MGNAQPAHRWLTLGAALLAAAFGLRLAGLQAKALWWDEGITVYLASLGPAEYFDLHWMDIHPPLYRLLLMGFVRLAGATDFSTRLFSVFCSVLAVALICRLGRRLLGPGGGLFAGLLAALSPFALFHAQEAKMYALLLALVALLLVAAERLLAGRAARRTWVAYVAAGALGLWTHYYMALLLLAINATYLALRVRRVKALPPLGGWVAAQALVLALFLPWALFEGARIPADADRTIGAATLSPLGFLGEVWSVLVAGYPALGDPLAALLGLAFLALVLLALAGGGRGRLLLGAALGLPLLVGMWISLRFPYNAPRFFIICAPPFALLVAAGCRALFARWRPAGRLAAGAVVAVSAAAMVAAYRQPSATDDYRPLVALLAAEGRADDPVLCGYPWQAGYVIAYARGVGRPAFPPPARFEDLADPGGRLWVLYFGTPEGAGDFVRVRLEAHGLRQVAGRASGESRIALFARAAAGD